MNYIDINTLNKKKPMFLHSPPENSVFGSLYESRSYSISGDKPKGLMNDLNKDTQSKFKFSLKGFNQTKGPNVQLNNHSNHVGPLGRVLRTEQINPKSITKNTEAYRKIWKAIHYIAIFYKPFPGEEKVTREAFITFIMCISELLPDESYSRHVKDFINKNPLDNLNSPIERFKWTYKLHSYINFFRFMKNLKYFLLYFNKNEVEILLYSYCNSLELNGFQRTNCINYVNSQIEQISNDINRDLISKDIEIDISIENISYEEALNMYTLTDTNIITKNDWGPTVWMMIHFFAFNLQKKNIYVYFKFIMSLTYLLPCEECKKHMRTNLKTIPLEITRNSNNESIFEWSFRFHNAVNKQTRKQEIKDKKTIENMYKENIIQTYEYV